MARVLVADDDRDLCWIWSETLADDGHEVVVAYDGEAAAAALESQMFDVLISDVVMPVSGAIVLAALARLRQPEIKVVAVSGSIAMRDRDIADDVEGADRTLRKPVDLETLCDTVRETLRAAAA